MSEILQRWRIVFARDDEARYLSHLDAVTQWERAFRRGAIPVATTGGFNARPKLVFAAPLQLGMLAEHELADLFLAERLTAPALRARLRAGMPAGYRVVELHDVWVGAPALAPQLVAADYRMTLLGVEREELASAAARLMAAERLQRERRRETKAIDYDLRPLIIGLRASEGDPAVAAADGISAGAAGLWMRLRHSQELGSGRTDEVVAALAEELGRGVTGAFTGADAGRASGIGSAPESPGAGRRTIEAVMLVRERLWLADELEVRRTPDPVTSVAG